MFVVQPELKRFEVTSELWCNQVLVSSLFQNFISSSQHRVIDCGSSEFIKESLFFDRAEIRTLFPFSTAQSVTSIRRLINHIFPEIISNFSSVHANCGTSEFEHACHLMQSLVFSFIVDRGVHVTCNQL